MDFIFLDYTINLCKPYYNIIITYLCKAGFYVPGQGPSASSFDFF